MLTTAIMFFCLNITPASAANLGLQHEIRAASEFESTQEAAKAGNVDAMAKLGSMYYLGQDIPEDDPRAIWWMSKAAKLNQPYAQACLGLFYLEGKIIPQSNLQAYIWLFKAAINGDMDVIKPLAFVRSQMSADQISEGNRILISGLIL